MSSEDASSTGDSGRKRRRSANAAAAAPDDSADATHADNADNAAADLLVQQQLQKQQQILLLQRFRTQRHSLRLSASRVAACCGFNPYTDLPAVVLDLIYQGTLGQLQLRHDAALLNMELISRDESLQNIARRAGPEVHAALSEIAEIKDGVRNPPKTVGRAQSLKDKAVTLARKSKNLSAQEVKSLQEGVRSAVDTSFGTHFENEALDRYEAMFGCEVRERNEGVYSWEFAKKDPEEAAAIGGDDQLGSTVAPIREARPLDDIMMVTMTAKTNDDCRSSVVDLTNDDEDTKEAGKESNAVATNHAAANPNSGRGPKERPYFCILGSIDGIRDDLYYEPPKAAGCSSSSSSSRKDCAEEEGKEAHEKKGTRRDGNFSEPHDDDEGGHWELRPIVIECKHRMERIYNPPPLYDQIQATVYCLMHGTAEADLVQVVRTERSKVNRSEMDNEKQDKRVKPNAAKKISAKCSDDTEQSQNVASNCDNEAKKQEAKEPDSDSSTSGALVGTELTKGTEEHAQQTDDSSIANQSQLSPQSPRHKRLDINITATRISLDDPATQHRLNFYRVILPRLRSLVDAIYAIRSDDDKRYRFLVAASVEDPQSQQRAWEMLFEECAWLRTCDTAYCR